MASIEIAAIQCRDETGGGLEVGSDEVAFCIAVLGVDSSAYAEFRRFETRLETGLEDNDEGRRFAEPVVFRARSREDGRSSYPLLQLEFHVAAYELDGSGDTAVEARRVYERWRVALAEALPPTTPTDVLRDDITAASGTARRGLRAAHDVRGAHQVVMADAWRLDIRTPRDDTFSAPGVGQSDGLYVAPSYDGISRTLRRWRNDERTSERRGYFAVDAQSSYSFYVNYSDR